MPMTELETDVLDALRNIQRSLSPAEGNLLRALQLREQRFLTSPIGEWVGRHQVLTGFALGVAATVFAVFA